MIDQRLDPYTPAAWLLLAAAPERARLLPALLDGLTAAMRDTRLYTTTDVNRHPLTLATAVVLIVPESLAPDRRLPVLGGLMVYLGETWVPLLDLLANDVEPALESLPAAAVAAPIAPREQLPIAEIRVVPRLPALDFSTRTGKKLNPWTVVADAKPVRGARPRWWADVLDMSRFVLTESPTEAIGPASARSPALAGALLVAVEVLRLALGDVDSALTVADVMAWLDACRERAEQTALGPAAVAYRDDLIPREGVQ